VAFKPAGFALWLLSHCNLYAADFIAEGVPERDTKHLIAYARTNNKASMFVALLVIAYRTGHGYTCVI
jgi:hypothetical protein